MRKRIPIDKAQALFKSRVGAGFSLHPPFKGFGMALIWFAMDEPALFEQVMGEKMPMHSFEEYIDTHVGFKAECLEAIDTSFGLHGHDAEILGKNVRAFLMVIRAGADEREKYIPQTSAGPGGNVESYIIMQALVEQNHLLQQLRSAPRYIRGGEWQELERVLRNSFSFSPEALRETHPNLTKGDIRVHILSLFKFSVSEQAILLGISPASVTKARQRLKAKCSFVRQPGPDRSSDNQADSQPDRA